MTEEGLSAASKPGSDERRRHPRAPVALAVRLRFDTVRDFLDAHAEDISASGMLLRGDELHHHGSQLMQLGQVLRLQFEAGNRRVVEGVARVVRIVPATAKTPAGVGIEFIELDELSRALVDAILAIKLATPFGG